MFRGSTLPGVLGARPKPAVFMNMISIATAPFTLATEREVQQQPPRIITYLADGHWYLTLDVAEKFIDGQKWYVKSVETKCPRNGVIHLVEYRDSRNKSFGAGAIREPLVCQAGGTVEITVEITFPDHWLP